MDCNNQRAHSSLQDFSHAQFRARELNPETIGERSKQLAKWPSFGVNCPRLSA
jgi:hypothetical protein